MGASVSPCSRPTPCVPDQPPATGEDVRVFLEFVFTLPRRNADRTVRRPAEPVSAYRRAG
jgi:hypothetical protein